MLVTRPWWVEPEGVFRLDRIPRVFEKLFHAERDAVGLLVDLDDLDLHLLADLEDLGRGWLTRRHANVGDVQGGRRPPPRSTKGGARTR